MFKSVQFNAAKLAFRFVSEIWAESGGTQLSSSPFLAAAGPRAIIESQVTVFCTFSAQVQIAHLLSNLQAISGPYPS